METSAVEQMLSRDDVERLFDLAYNDAPTSSYFYRAARAITDLNDNGLTLANNPTIIALFLEGVKMLVAGRERAATTLRGVEWGMFADRVMAHVDMYTVKQYGDKGGDRLETMTSADCVHQIAKYVLRFGKGARGDVEERRDMFKIAHYAQVAYDKMAAGKGKARALTRAENGTGRGRRKKVG